MFTKLLVPLSGPVEAAAPLPAAPTLALAPCVSVPLVLVLSHNGRAPRPAPAR